MQRHPNATCKAAYVPCVSLMFMLVHMRCDNRISTASIGKHGYPKASC
jgi:hypothetical protein